MLPRLKVLIGLMFVTVFLCGLTLSSDVSAADKENCLMCHKYAGNGRFDDKGHRKIFYVNEEVFRTTVHGFLRCRQCHQDINKIPHIGAKKVNCTVDCHLVEPSTKDWGEEKKNFSHGKVAAIFNVSVHNPETRSDGKKRKNPEDVPTCKYCHTNPKYYTGATAQAVAAEKRETAVVNDICGQCHENLEWAKRFYGHFTRRVNKRRGAAQMVELCLGCHSDVELMNRNGLPPINAFEDSFHFKAIKFGDTRVPDCLGCHAPLGFPAHSIKTLEDPDSAVYAQNRLQNTCALEDCHGANTTEDFASGRVHNIDVDVRVGKGLLEGMATDYIKETIEKGNKFDEIMTEKTRAGAGTELEVLILNLVRFVYLFLIIAPTLIGMFLHQILDLYSTLRDRKKGGHH